MHCIFFVLVVLLYLCTSAVGATYYLAPPGNHTDGKGTKDSPFGDIQSAWEAMISGDTLILQPGDYDVSIAPPKNLSGSSWTNATIIAGEGKVRLIGAGNRIAFNGGWQDLSKLAATFGCQDAACLNQLPSLNRRAHEYFIIRNIEIDGSASYKTKQEFSLLLVTNGARRIRFERINAHSFASPPGSPIDHDAHIMGAFSADWAGSSPTGREYYVEVIVANSTIGPVPEGATNSILYWSGRGFQLLDSTITNGSGIINGLNFNAATETIVLRSTIQNVGFAGGGGSRNVFMGNRFLNSSEWRTRGHTNMVMHNTFTNTAIAQRFTHASVHYAHFFAGNIYESVGTAWRDESQSRTSLNFMVARDNLINQGVVNPQDGSVLNPAIVGRAVPPPTLADVFDVSKINRQEAFDFWQSVYQRWLAEGGHTTYGAVTSHARPPTLQPPQHLRLLR
jgi:hypothetical protein